MFEQWSAFVLVFLGFLLLGFFIYLLGNRKLKEEEMKSETYTCGEPFPKANVGAENFYHAIKSALGIRELRRKHSGRLSDYLVWIVIGTVAVILLVIAWI